MIGRIFAKLPDGKLVSRQTYKRYTHVVARRASDGSWFVRSWTARPERFRASEKRGEIRLIEVEKS